MSVRKKSHPSNHTPRSHHHKPQKVMSKSKRKRMTNRNHNNNKNHPNHSSFPFQHIHSRSTQEPSSQIEHSRYTNTTNTIINNNHHPQHGHGHHIFVPTHPNHPSLNQLQPTNVSSSLYTPSQHNSSYHQSRHSSINYHDPPPSHRSSHSKSHHHKSRKLHRHKSDPSRRGSRYTNNQLDHLPDIPDSMEVYNDNIHNDINYNIYINEQQKQQKQKHYKHHQKPRHSSSNIQHILKAVRREYQQQVDHVIDKWKELLDRAQADVEKYRNIYHSERSHTKKLQQTIDQLKSKLKKYKNKDNENQIIILNLQQRLNELYDDLTEITTPSHTPRYYYMSTPKQILSGGSRNGSQNIYNKPKFPLASPKKIRQHNDSYYNYGRSSNNLSLQNMQTTTSTSTIHPNTTKGMISDIDNDTNNTDNNNHNNNNGVKTPLKSTLPPPTNNSNSSNINITIVSPNQSNKSRRNSRSGNNLSVLPPPSMNSTASVRSQNQSELVCAIHTHLNNQQKHKQRGDRMNKNIDDVLDIDDDQNEDIDVEDDDIILIHQNVDITHKIAKTRDDLRKILDAIDDNNGMNNNGSMDSLNATSGNDDHLNLTDATTNKCISIIIKYKDKLFKNKSNTIKVSSAVRLNDFVNQLCDSININPELIQLQHHMDIIDIHLEENKKKSLRELDIDNFDNIFVYIDYNKLLTSCDKILRGKHSNNTSNNTFGDDITDDTKTSDPQDENDLDLEININRLNMDNQTMELIKKSKSLFKDLSDNFMQNTDKKYNVELQEYSKNMLLLQSSIISLYEYCVNLENEQSLYAIITDCILENNPILMCKLLCNKISKIIKCQFVRLYFKWNNIIQIIYPQNINIKQQIIIDLNDDNHDNKSLLMDIINEYKEREGTPTDDMENVEENDNNLSLINSMKCYNNPSQSDSNFNTIFNKQFNYNIDSTLIAPLLFKNEQYIDEQLIGIIQLINKQNKTNFEFTLNDKKLLAPLTKVIAVALKVLYHISSSHKIFAAINGNDNTMHHVDRIINSQSNSRQNPISHNLFSHRFAM